MKQILISKLDQKATIPTRHHFDDAGYDLYAMYDGFVFPGKWSMVATGIAIAIPEGYVGLIHPRSGHAARNGITVLNAPGTIDAGYRGEVSVILINHSPNLFEYRAGDRIAQILFQKIETPLLLEVDGLPETLRGELGFGSSGI